MFDIFTRREENVPHSSFEKEKDVEFAERRFEQYKSTQKKWAKQAHEDTEFRNNIVFTSDQKKAIEDRGLAPVGVPLLHQAVDQAVSMLTARTPSFQATAREDSDVKVARLFADILSYIWYISDGNQRLKTAIDDYYVKGRGVLFAYIDPDADVGRGEVMVTDLDPLEVYPDPNSRDKLWRDAADIFVSRLITREQAQATWPHLREKIKKAETTQVDEAHITGRQAIEDQQLQGDVYETEHEKLRLLERYAKVRMPEFHVFEGEEEQVLSREDYDRYRTQPAFIIQSEDGIDFAISETDVSEVADLFEQFGPNVPMPGPAAVGPAGDLQQDVQIAQLYPLTKGQLIDEGIIQVREVQVTRIEVLCTLGGVKLYKYVLPTEHYPLVPLNNLHNRNPYPVSDARLVKPMIEQYNKTQQIIIAHAASIAGAKYWVQENTISDGVEEKLANPAPSILTYRGQQPPVPHQPSQLPSEFYANQDRLKAQIHEILGLYPFQQGDPTNAPETFRGTLQMDEYNLRRIKSKLDDIYAGLNQLAKVSIDLAQNVYTHQKTIRLVEPNGDPRTLALNQPLYDTYGRVTDLINDVSAVKADVVVVSGSTMPSNRYALLDYYLQFYQNGIIDQVEVLKKSEIFDREGVLQRFSDMAKMAQQIEAQEEEIKKLKGDLQTREREVYHAKQGEELAKFEKALEEPKARVKKSAELYEQRLADRLKNNEAIFKEIDEL